MSNNMGPEWVKEQQARVETMDELYKLDKRETDPNHPHKGTYTGLWQEVLTYQRLCEELAIYEKWKARGYPELPRSR